MSKGKPVLLSNYEQFAEFPDDCCLKVDLGPAEEPMLLEYLRLLAGDEALRRRIGENARRYVSTHNHMDRTIQGYVQVLQQVVAANGKALCGENETMEQNTSGQARVDIPAIMATIRRQIAQQIEEGQLSPPERERYQAVVTDWLMEEIRLALAERWHAGELIGPDMGRYHTLGSPPKDLEKNLEDLNERWNQVYEPHQVESSTPVLGNLWAAIRRRIHEEVRSYLDPMIYRQSDIYGAVVASLNVLAKGLYGGSLASDLQTLYAEMLRLKQQVLDLESRLEEREGLGEEGS
jgi:hypothetical protein